MMTRMSLAFLVAATAACSLPVNAQQRELQRCAAIDDSLERLVCYDELAASYVDKSPAERPEKAKQKDVPQSRNAAAERFGMEHKNARDMEGMDKLTVNVAEREKDPYGNWVITLDNGQVWKQTESVGYFSWDEKDTYYIERGALNSFFFGREDATRRFRVTRIK